MRAHRSRPAGISQSARSAKGPTSSAFRTVPKGAYVLEVWHPQLRPGRSTPRETIEIGDAAATASYSLPLLPDPRDTGDRARY